MRTELHKKLQHVACGYLINKGYWICGEEVPMPLGVCDAWGMSRSKDLHSMGIEVKVSRQDFRSQSQIYKEQSPRPIGDLQYLLCPEGLIQPNEVHGEWGLLWWNGEKIINKKRAPEMQMTDRQKLQAIIFFLHNGANIKRPHLVEDSTQSEPLF